MPEFPEACDTCGASDKSRHGYEKANFEHGLFDSELGVNWEGGTGPASDDTPLHKPIKREQIDKNVTESDI